jgi:hypothetical protein
VAFTQHVLQRTVVLPELRVLFLPVPKAGCTSVLWLLAEMAGLGAEQFARSPLPEVTPALTVHDMNVWGAGRRLGDYEGDERERVLHEDGWLRFSLVRHPGTRLWSAWQSKLLLREPRFVEALGDAPWFPRVPDDPAHVVEDFRRFVSALPSGNAEDVHWAVQRHLTGQLPLNHVGRVERLADTLAALRAHVGEAHWPGGPGRENRSPLPLPAHAYDAPAAAILHDRHAPDLDAFGYDRLEPAPADPEWDERVGPLLPLLRDTIAEHARIAQLQRLAQQRGRRLRGVEERLETVSARHVGHARSPVITNDEGETEFDVRWAWADGDLEPGMTAVVRVRDEAPNLPLVLPPLLRAVRHVVLVDNGSTDGTAAVARRVAAECGASRRLEVVGYPFAVARCGSEHLGTSATSVHSLAHFYNWSFARVRTGYALKWDGDMVLTDAAVAVLRDLAWQLEAAEAIVRIPRHPLYVADDRVAFLDLGLRNCEPWAWPNRPGYSFVKALEWELPLWSPHTPVLTLPDRSCIELKHLDADEFSHWSATDFDASPRTRRKRRECEVFQALAGGAAPPDGVVAVEAPTGMHVVDYVRTAWAEATGAAGTALGAVAG